MNQETALKKINDLGKAGSIIALIFKVIFIIGFVATLIGFIALRVLPKDLFSINVDGVANVVVDGSGVGQNTIGDDLTIDDINGIDGSISYNDAKLGLTSVTGNGSKIEIDAAGNIANFNMRTISYVVLLAMIDIAMCFVTALFAGFLCKAFANCSSPFDEDVIKKLKMFAFSLIPWALVNSVSTGMSSLIFSGNSKLSLNLNIGIIVIVLVILALSYIFQYGAVLQKESDETL